MGVRRMMKAAAQVFGSNIYDKKFKLSKELCAWLDKINAPSYYSFFRYVQKIDNQGLASFYNYVMSSKVRKTYIEEYIPYLKQKASYSEDLDNSNFKAEFTFIENQTVYGVLMNTRVEITPLYRYLLAESEGHYDVSEHFEESAILCLKDNPFLFQYYKDYHKHFPIKPEDINE